MIRLLFLFLMLPTIVNAAPPSRQTTYTTLTTIRSADVTGNEDVIFNYLQGGVDTFADNSIVNADINSSAAISYAKLNLANAIVNADVSSSAAIGYSKLSLSGSILNADISSSAAIVGSKLDLTSPGAIGSTAANTGAFSTLKVGTTNQGDILYDNGTSLVRLTPGTSGQFLKTQGASANPVWASESGTGTVNSGTASRFSYYATTGTEVSDQTVLTTNGTNIGVGTASPTATLEVNGSFVVKKTPTSWSMKSGTNLTCDTSCGTSMCAFGFDTTSSLPVDCATASAERCICVGP